MKRTISIIFSIIFALVIFEAAAQTPDPTISKQPQNQMYVSGGQKTVSVGIQITQKIKKDNQKTELESAVVSHDVLNNGKVVIAAGTPVTLDVQMEKRRGVGKPGTITVKPVSTTDVNGQIVMLTGDAKTDTGKNRRGAAVGCGVAFGIILFPVGLLFLCIKGGHASIPAGAQMVANATLN